MSLRAEFEAHGYVGPMEVLDRGLLLEARAAADELLQHFNAESLATTFDLHNRHLDIDALWCAATAPRILEVVSEIFAADLVLLGTRLVCKLGGSGAVVPWHQDIPMMGLAPTRTVTAWVALDDADADNGALELIPGDPHCDPHHHDIRERHEEQGLLTNVEVSDLRSVEGARAVRPRVPAGQAIWFGGGILHGGSSNPSPRRRCAMTVRFVESSTRPTREGQWPAVALGDFGDHFGNRTREESARYEASRRR